MDNREVPDGVIVPSRKSDRSISTDQTSQDGVHQTGQTSASHRPRQLDCLVDYRIARHSRQVNELVSGGTKDVEYKARDRFQALIDVSSQNMIDATTQTCRTVSDLRRQAAITRGETGLPKYLVETFIEEDPTSFSAEQCVQDGPSSGCDSLAFLPARRLLSM